MNLVLTLGLCGFAGAFALRLSDPMVPLFAADFGVDLTTAAFVSTAYALPYALCQPVLGPISDAVGRVVTIRWSLVLLAIGLTAAALAPTFSTLLGGRILSGLVGGGIIPVCMALIGDRIPIDRRQIAVGRFIIATISGQMAGALCGGVVGSLTGWRPVFAFSAVLAVASAAVAWLVLKPSTGPRTAGDASAPRKTMLSRIIGVFDNPRAKWVYLMVMAEGAAMFGVFPFVAAILRSHGASGAFEAGLAIGAFGIGGVLYAISVPWLLRQLGQLPMARLGGIISGLMLLILAVPVPWWAVIPPLFIVGFTFYMLHNTLQTQATELAPAARGTAVAIFASSFFGGQAIGPLIFAGISELSSFSVATIILALALPALGLLAPKLLIR